MRQITALVTAGFLTNSEVSVLPAHLVSEISRSGRAALVDLSSATIWVAADRIAVGAA